MSAIFRGAYGSGRVSLPKYQFIKFGQDPICVKKRGAGACTGATGDVNEWLIPSYGDRSQAVIIEQFIKGAGQTIVAPIIGSNGLDVAFDLTATEGMELGFGITALCPMAFTVGTHRFGQRLKLNCADVSGGNPLMVGFRKIEAYQAAHTSYTDFSAIGLVGGAGDVKSTTRLNSGANTIVDTTVNGADGVTIEFSITVDKDGSVRWFSDGAAVNTSTSFVHDAGDVLVPFIDIIHGIDVMNTVELMEWEVGEL